METKQEMIVRLTRQAVDGLIRAVRAMPEEKRTWAVDGVGRSAIDQLQECAQCPLWFVRVLQERVSPFSPEFFAEQKAERIAWTDLDDLERRLRENSEKLYDAILATPDELFDTPVELRPGWTLPFGDLGMFPLRNLWYHLGQTNFVQTLYGDQEMH